MVVIILIILIFVKIPVIIPVLTILTILTILIMPITWSLPVHYFLTNRRDVSYRIQVAIIPHTVHNFSNLSPFKQRRFLFSLFCDCFPIARCH